MFPALHWVSRWVHDIWYQSLRFNTTAVGPSQRYKSLCVNALNGTKMHFVCTCTLYFCILCVQRLIVNPLVGLLNVR
jgi:hypothetical protein